MLNSSLLNLFLMAVVVAVGLAVGRRITGTIGV